MKSGKLLIVFFLAMSFYATAQNRNSVWCFGDSAGIDFSNINNPVPYYSAMRGRGSCVNIANNFGGGALFYANSYSLLFKTLVWGANNDTMQNGDFLGDGLYNEQQIIPFPDGQNKYYLFYTGARGFVDGLYYAIVDMNLNGGFGEVTITNQQINTNRIADCMQAVKHGNGRDWWLITKTSNATLTSVNRFVIYLITPQGISQPSYYDFGNAYDLDFQKLIFNNTYTKLMNVNIGGYMCEFDFDRCSGVISNPHVIYPEITTPPFNRYFWEGAYSPNDSVFYVSTIWVSVSQSDTSRLLQYNLADTNIALTCDTLAWWRLPFQTGAIRLAPDNKIYVTNAYATSNVNFPYPDSVYNYINMNLSVINEPDNLGAACNFQPFSFYLGGKRTYLGLPNNPKYDLGALAGSVCDTLTNLTPDPSPLGEGSIKVFPNPAKEKVRFEYSEPVSENSQIEVYDNLGVMVKKIILTKGSISTTFSINDLPPGMYLCRVFINNAYSQSNKLTIIR